MKTLEQNELNFFEVWRIKNEVFNSSHASASAAATGVVSLKKVFLKISQNSQANI